MKELVFLLEEASAKAMLESLLPRILHPDIHTRLIPFEGKQDLGDCVGMRIHRLALSSYVIKTVLRIVGW